MGKAYLQYVTEINVLDMDKFLKKELFKYPNVRGYAKTLQNRQRKGKTIDELCIQIHVTKKVSLKELRKQDIIPSIIKGIPIDVVEFGEIKALPLSNVKNVNKTTKIRPLVAGISIGNVSITAGCVPSGFDVWKNPDGKDISEISVGEDVLTLNGKEKVLWKGSRFFSGNLVKIDPWYLPEIELTPNHPVLVSDKKYSGTYLVGHSELKWEKAEELSGKEYLVVPRIKKRGKAIPSWWSKFLGWYLAEGSCSKDRRYNYRIRISIKKGTYEEELEKITSKVAKVFSKHQTYSKSILKSGMIEFTIYSKKLFEELCKFGNSAWNKRIPEYVLESTKENIWDFLEAYRKGDGWELKRTEHPEQWFFSTVSKNIVWDLFYLINRLGYVPSIRKRIMKTRIIKGRVLNPTQWFEIGLSLGSKNYYKRKSDYFLVSIKGISRKPFRGKVYNFSTPSQHYCMPFVVHNTLGWFMEKTMSPDKGEVFLGSNAHVLAEEPKNKTSNEKRILQPGDYDGGTEVVAEYYWHKQLHPLGDISECSVSNIVVNTLNVISELLGRKTRFLPIVEELNHIDFAVARMSTPWESCFIDVDLPSSKFCFVGLGFAGSDQVSLLCKQQYIINEGYRPFGYEVTEALAGDVIHKTGRTSCYSKAPVTLESAYELVNYGNYYVVFDDVIVTEGKLLEPGDSGSATWKEK